MKKKKELVQVLLTHNWLEMVATAEKSLLDSNWVESTVEGVAGVVWRWVAPASLGPKPSELTGTESLEVLQDSFTTFCGSYERVPALLALKSDPGDPLKWFRLLGEEWEVCDNIGHHKEAIQERLQSASRSQLDVMMTPEELNEWMALPDIIVAFRGCSAVNIDGMSFSLDRDLAARFPTLQRYFTPHPILIEAKIPKEFTVLKLGREEREIISTREGAAEVVAITPLS